MRARSARSERGRGAVGPPRASRARGAGAVGEWRPWVSDENIFALSWLNEGRWSRERDTVGSRIRGGGGRGRFRNRSCFKDWCVMTYFCKSCFGHWLLTPCPPRGCGLDSKIRAPTAFPWARLRELQTLLPDRSFVISLPLPLAPQTSEPRTARVEAPGARLSRARAIAARPSARVAARALPRATDVSTPPRRSLFHHAGGADEQTVVASASRRRR